MRLAKQVLGFFMFLVLLSPVLVMAQETGSILTAKADELIVKSGLQRQIGQLPEVVSASFEQRMAQDDKIGPEEAAKIREAITRSVTPSVMLASIKDHIIANLAEPDVDGIMIWLNSPLGEKITKMEEDASSGQAYMEIQNFAMGLSNDPPDPVRVAVLGQLDEAARMTEFSVGMKMDMIVTMTTAMAAAAGRTDFTKEELLASLESSRAQIEQGSAQEVLITGLYTYQGLTIDELKEYVNFYKSEAGQKYADVITRGLLNALNKSSQDMGERLGKVIKDENASEAKPNQ